MRTLAIVLSLSLFTAPAVASEGSELQRAEVGQPAPGFTLTDLEGDETRLADHRGKVVVLEWFNPDCPYVDYAHSQGPLGELPAKWAEQGVVWLAINSNRPGSQGSDPELNKSHVDEWGLPNSVLVDTDGTVGRKYGAKTTPQMYIVDPEGTLVYNGALDNAPLGKVHGDAYQGWVDEALTAVTSGGEIPRAQSKPYGCSVKYGS